MFPEVKGRRRLVGCLLVFFYVLYIIEDIHDRSEYRKKHKPQYGDRQRADVKKSTAEKERNKDEQVFDVILETQ
jgi:hypothetical protein